MDEIVPSSSDYIIPALPDFAGIEARFFTNDQESRERPFPVLKTAIYFA